MATVVSISPVSVISIKPGLFPNEWRLPKASYDKPEIVHVPVCYHQVYIGDGKWIRVPNLPDDVAKSIVEDNNRATICCNFEAHPGLFWLPGNLTVLEVKTKHRAELDAAVIAQEKWFDALILMADDDWTRSKHLHVAISDLQRMIARVRKLDKEWLYVPKVDPTLIQCKSCFSYINPNAVICPNCKLILNKVEYDKMVFA